LTAPFLLWLPATRWLVLVESALFHGGIGLFMGLVLFALQATMFLFIVFPDPSYRRLADRIARLPTRFGRQDRRAVPG